MSYWHCNPLSRRWAYAHYSGCAPGVSRRRSRTEPAHTYESRQSGAARFGIRRPLRYLSYHLDLDEAQRRQVAASLEQIKLEREQIDLSRKRANGVLADRFVQPEVSVDDFRQALSRQEQAETQLRTVIAKSLHDIADVLDEEQRDEFAHLLRTGVLKL